MIGDIKGYCMLRGIDNTIIGVNERMQPTLYAEVRKLIQTVPLRIIDIAVDNSGFLCLEPGGRAICQVNSMTDVGAYFLCDSFANVLLPTGLNPVQKMAESARRLNRKGGYNDIVRKLVIAASIQKGEFYDNFLFTKQ